MNTAQDTTMEIIPDGCPDQPMGPAEFIEPNPADCTELENVDEPVEAAPDVAEVDIPQESPAAAPTDARDKPRSKVSDPQPASAVGLALAQGLAKCASSVDEFKRRLPKGKQQTKQKPKRARHVDNIPVVGKDGVDHINIVFQGGTKLGSLLDIKNRQIPFEHPVLKGFQSIENAWAYITSSQRDELLRHADEATLRTFSKIFGRVKVPNFKAIIAECCYARVKANPALEKLLRESTLPFECYFVPTNYTAPPRHHVYHDWFRVIMTIIRHSVINNVEPDFRQFIDIRNSTPCQFV